MESKTIPAILNRIITVIFHPLFMPFYGLLIVFNAPTLFWYIPVKAKIYLFLIFFIDNLLIPALLMPFFRYRNIISSWKMETRSDRTVPLMAVSLMYAVTSFILSKLELPVFFKAYSYSVTMLLIAILTINRWWKISIYSAAAGVVTACVVTLSIRMSAPLPFLLAATVLVSGLIISSRLRLNRHDPGEVYAGFLTGLLITAGFMLLLQ